MSDEETVAAWARQKEARLLAEAGLRAPIMGMHNRGVPLDRVCRLCGEKGAKRGEHSGTKGNGGGKWHTIAMARLACCEACWNCPRLVERVRDYVATREVRKPDASTSVAERALGAGGSAAERIARIERIEKGASKDIKATEEYAAKERTEKDMEKLAERIRKDTDGTHV